MAAMAERATLVELPLDVQLHVLKRLDGRSLARYAECTSLRLACALAEDNLMAPLWAGLHRTEIAAAPTVPTAPQPEELLAFVRPRAALHDAGALTAKHDAAACKAAYVRGSSAIERRCPRCGRQSGGRHGGGPLDDHGQGQRHLCDWLVARPCPSRPVVPLS